VAMETLASAATERISGVFGALMSFALRTTRRSSFLQFWSVAGYVKIKGVFGAGEDSNRRRGPGRVGV
jgi:hypothetical protein